MIVVTSRSHFEKLIDFRMKEAKLLFENQCWDGAYYIAGYVVEFALKIRIIGQLMKSDSFPPRKVAENFYKHELTELRRLAELDTDMEKDPEVNSSWDIVKDWSEQTRYTVGKTEQDAEIFLEAIEKEVLPWIKARW